MNVSEFLLRIVQGLGTDTGFCLTGGMAMHINRAAAQSSLRMIYCNHEQAVAAAADGYAKARDFRVPGLAVVTSGPGVTNTITSVASAYYDSVPMVILAGQVKQADINAHGVRSRGAQETPQLELMAPITKCAFRYVPEEVDDATLAARLGQCVVGRKGPVFVEIPLDLQALAVADGERRATEIVERIRSAASQGRMVRSSTIDRMAGELASAKRPLLVLGNALRIAGVDRGAVRELVETVGAPALFTWASFDLLEHQHRLNFGCAGGLAPTHANRILQSADVIVFLGTRLDLLTTAFNPANYGKSARRLIVELDEAEIAKNADMPDATFFCEDAGGVLQALLDRGVRASCDPDWLEQCQAWRLEDERAEARAFSADRLTSYQLARILSEARSASYIVPTASGYAIEGVARFFKPTAGATFAWAGHVLGSMGLGLPTAIGAVAARREPVVCLEGDGGVMLNIQELFTLAANPDLPLTLIIMNNGGYQSILKSQQRAFGKEFGASTQSGLFTPDFKALAALAGLPYERCDTVRSLEEALSDGPPRRIIEAIVQEDGYRGPSVTTKFDENGKPYSTDIGDVSWSSTP